MDLGMIRWDSPSQEKYPTEITEEACVQNKMTRCLNNLKKFVFPNKNIDNWNEVVMWIKIYLDTRQHKLSSSPLHYAQLTTAR